MLEVQRKINIFATLSFGNVTIAKKGNERKIRWHGGGGKECEGNLKPFLLQCVL